MGRRPVGGDSTPTDMLTNPVSRDKSVRYVERLGWHIVQSVGDPLLLATEGGRQDAQLTSPMTLGIAARFVECSSQAATFCMLCGIAGSVQL